MSVGVIDADLIDGGTHFPNLALMKLSGFHGGADLIDYEHAADYEKVYLSKVFTDTKVPALAGHVQCGGTGFDMEAPLALPHWVEHHKPDYYLYEGHVEKTRNNRYYFNTSVGFTTRGCFRGCSFCVNKHYKASMPWSPVSEFDDDENKWIVLLDDNVLGCSSRVDILKDLVNRGKPFTYKQGLDIRLMNDEVANLLVDASYLDDYYFAFDNYADRDVIVPKLADWMARKPRRHTVVYLLTAFKSQDVTDIVELFERIKLLMQLGCQPYVMRYKDYEQSDLRGMYINIARWCNQPSVFKKMSFREAFAPLPEHYSARRYMDDFEKRYPEVAAQYFDMKNGDINA